MRENLFRGKRKDNGEWVYGDLSLYSEPGEIEIAYPTMVEDEEFNLHETFDYAAVDWVTVGQYICVNDKNDTKIFEGDILLIHNDYNGDRNPFPALVGFAEGSFVTWGERRCGYTTFDSWNTPLVWWEVIGNIHDNPELIDMREVRGW